MNYRQSAKDIASELGSDLEKGLTIKKAHERIHGRGRNIVRIPRKMGFFVSISRHIFSLMNVILLALAAAHLLLGQRGGPFLATVFLLCAIANTVVGYINFSRDNTPFRMMSAAQNENVRVIRDGIENEVPAMLLAQGDVILLGSGQTVPADAKIIESAGVVADESILSGDGSSVPKAAGSGASEDENETVIYMGTRLISGRLKAIVTATGRDTQLGSTVGLMSGSEGKVSSLARKNAYIGNVFGSLAAVVWLAALLTRLIGGYGIGSALNNSLTAAVSVLPATMPPLVLLTMNLNALKLRRGGIRPRSASAVETIGASSMLVVGKRGTLTQSGFEVTEIRPANGFDENKLRLLAAMCTTADLSGDVPIGDPMQVALIDDALKNGLTIAEFKEKIPTELVLDNHRESRLMTTIHKTENGHIVICKGAPEAVAACCGRIYDNGIRPFDAAGDLSALIETSNRMSAEAMSVMAVAFKETVYAPQSLDAPPASDLIFVGFVGLSTAIRKDTPAAVKQLRAMGVKTCIITNESLTTASAVAEKSGISRDNAVQASNVDVSDVNRLRKTSVFADVGSRQKAEIVAALNAEKENVIVVGRGIRDISAMNAADASIATDAGAKICAAAADVKVGGSGLGKIAAAVRECKRAFINVERLIGFLLGCSVAQVVCAAGALIMGYSVPFSSVGVMCLELAVAAVAAVGIWFEPYRRSPVKRTELNTMKSGRLSSSVLRLGLIRGLLLGAAAMTVYRLLDGHADIGCRRCAVMLILCMGFAFMAQSWRSADLTVKHFLENPVALVCMALNIAAGCLMIMLRPVRELLSIEVPDAATVALCVAAGLIPAVLSELLKLIFPIGGKKRKKKGAANERNE